ncbi:MAG: ssl1498 family light-harvesting-like protein [Spirulina sp. SIO3F2]|nr:ssl1498 family light-harvesting-like protein [Spirulina sp. SIO3F2]
MPYTKEEGGRLNNFAIEPEVYVAEPPTATEKRNYVIWGALALTLVSGIVFVAFSVTASV